MIILNLTFAPKSRSEALHLNIEIYHYILFFREKELNQVSRDLKQFPVFFNQFFWKKKSLEKRVMKNLSLFNLGRNPENEKNIKKERIIRKGVPMKWLFQFKISSNKNMRNGLSAQHKTNFEI